MEFGSLDAILGCVAAGVGIALLPRAVVEAKAPGLPVRTLPRDMALLDTFLVRPRDGGADAAIRTLLELLSEPAPAGSNGIGKEPAHDIPA